MASGSRDLEQKVKALEEKVMKLEAQAKTDRERIEALESSLGAK